MESSLTEVLTAVDKPTELYRSPDGSVALILPYGGRVLGLYAPASDENFYWTHPALESARAAREFYASDEWHNSGGDRTWLAPEVDFFFPNWPDKGTYWQPRPLDPGDYRIERAGEGLSLVNRLTVTPSRSRRDIELEITKSVSPALNPLRYERELFQTDAVVYAGYTLRTTLVMKSGAADSLGPVGLWNLVQMPHGGDLLIPTYARTRPRIYFGSVADDDLVVADRLVRYKMRGSGEHKLGIRAVATTGRVGYIYAAGDGSSALIVRNVFVNPSGEYVDVPWDDADDVGYSMQACNVNSALGSFSELEYHVPAIGRGTGRAQCEDLAQVWAFRGPDEAIRAVARRLLSPET